MTDDIRKIDRKSRSRSEWEERFAFWSTPPSKTEEERIERTASDIAEAIRLSPKISSHARIFPQGSYANRVNVRQDSDVDMCCLSDRTVFFDLAPGMTAEDTNLTFPVTYDYKTYKDEVEAALVSHFGRNSVRREGNKAIDVNSTTSLVDADVVACFEYRLFYRKGFQPHVGTILFRDDTNASVTGFPQQHKMNGQAKNEKTSRRYRQQVRIIKTLRNNMERWGISSAGGVSSFGLESLLWNVPDERYLSQSTHFGRLVSILEWAFDRLDSAPSTLMEVNNIKGLFGSHSDRTPLHYKEFLVSLSQVLSA